MSTEVKFPGTGRSLRQLDLGMGATQPTPRPRAQRRGSPSAVAQLALFEGPQPVDPVAELSDQLADAANEDAEADLETSRPSPSRLPRATIRGQVRVEAFLRGLLGPRVLVRLTENRSTMISFSTKKGVTYVRLHAIFSEAPEHVLGAVARFVAEKRPGPKTAWLIDQWIEAHRHLVKRPERAPRVLPRGEVHDLQAIYDELNPAYFRDRVDARITWSVAAKKQKRSSIRLGSYLEDEKLIRIHPALDQSFVPEFFVASVVFHEMLHQLHGAHEALDGTRRVHTPAFRRDEAKFAEFRRARQWEAENLHRLLRY